MDGGQSTAEWGAAFVYACVYLAWLHPGELSYLSCIISGFLAVLVMFVVCSCVQNM